MWIDFAGQFQKSLTALPLKTYQAGDTVLASGSRTNELLDSQEWQCRSCQRGHRGCKGNGARRCVR